MLDETGSCIRLSTLLGLAKEQMETSNLKRVTLRHEPCRETRLQRSVQSSANTLLFPTLQCIQLR